MSGDHSHSVEVRMTLLDGYKFEIDFGDFGQLQTDEPEPLGQGEGPNPMRVLMAAVANCLSASLMFAIRKFKQEPGEVWARVSAIPERVNNRLRVTNMAVEIHLGNEAENLEHLQRALDQFEDFCIVTQSVRSGVDIDVSVFDAANHQVK